MYPLPHSRLAASGTAIVAIHTEQGFVICADGRRSKYTGEIISDNEQKIFEIQCESGALAYGHFGITTLHDDKSGEVAHDLRVPVRHAFQLATSLQEEEFGKFVHQVAQNIHTKLQSLKESDPEVTFHEETVMQFIVGGYWRNERAMAKLTFTQSAQALNEPMLVAYQPRKTRWEPALSEEVFCRVFEGKEAFSRYNSVAIVKLAHQENLSLSEGIDAAKSLVEACCDPAAREIDYKCCHIGGHIHMATITPNAGFEWIIPPATEAR